LPFGTIFSSLASLQKTVERHGGAITRFLDWVADKEEWGVKGVLNRAKAKEAILSGILDQHGERLASLSPGARYFEEERIRRRSEKELKQWLEEICGKAADNLRRGSSGFRERKVPCGTGGDTDVVVNWAFLLPGNYVTEFRAEVDRVNEGQAKQGLVFEVSGPWPPYSFCPCLEEEQER
jgi:hypothetical protein